mmetsp:Transcript_38447/g.81511  ORF Transcript_38447/g.81511 Transcript_38447/m.81511 type:complete len:281 (+) Transcript_38447:1615-2457(+)
MPLPQRHEPVEHRDSIIGDPSERDRASGPLTRARAILTRLPSHALSADLLDHPASKARAAPALGEHQRQRSGPNLSVRLFLLGLHDQANYWKQAVDSVLGVGPESVGSLPIQVCGGWPPSAGDEDWKGQLEWLQVYAGHESFRGRLPVCNALSSAPKGRSEQGLAAGFAIWEDDKVSCLDGDIRRVRDRRSAHGLDVLLLAVLPQVLIVDTRFQLGLQDAAVVKAQSFPVDVRIPGADAESFQLGASHINIAGASCPLDGALGFCCRQTQNHHSSSPREW